MLRGRGMITTGKQEQITTRRMGAEAGCRDEGAERHSTQEVKKGEVRKEERWELGESRCWRKADGLYVLLQDEERLGSDRVIQPR